MALPVLRQSPLGGASDEGSLIRRTNSLLRFVADHTGRTAVHTSHYRSDQIVEVFPVALIDERKVGAFPPSQVDASKEEIDLDRLAIAFSLESAPDP